MTPAIYTENTILVALSGGVDSAVCARLLLQQGRTVKGVYFIMSEAHFAGVDAAKASAANLEIELVVEDLRGRFRKDVVEPFCESYCAGLTPNPCINCNPNVKFGALCEVADRLGVYYIASGHYAQLEQLGEFIALKRAVSVERDQSYMLCRLTQQQLQRLVLPLGGYTKPEVRQIARENGFSNAETPDSQEICFIPDGDYAAYINTVGHHGNAGQFISPAGLALGAHKGVEHYTIGQRRGLHVALGEPVYVKQITEKGDILLGSNADLYKSGVVVNQTLFNPAFSELEQRALCVKLRSVAKPAQCEITLGENDEAKVVFRQPQRAPAPGQSAVLYDGEYLVGCGYITKTLP